MEDVTLSWPGSMTTEQAKKYLLTDGFVAVELFRQQIHQLEILYWLNEKQAIPPELRRRPKGGRLE